MEPYAAEEYTTTTAVAALSRYSPTTAVAATGPGRKAETLPFLAKGKLHNRLNLSVVS